MSNTVRQALKAGSWYEADETVLSQQLDDWLHEAHPSLTPNSVRAIIAPHAGYSYSGSTAAYAYKFLHSTNIKRIFLLGPSHHSYFETGGFSPASELQTPLGNLLVDRELIGELSKTKAFIDLSRKVDEQEHSLELHMPYIAKCLQRNGSKNVKIVPIMIGHLSKTAQAEMGAILAPYLDDPENFFIISSDFCHWGKRFSYTHYNEQDGAIHKSIEALDRDGMKAITTLSADNFRSYLKETQNTICGRVPILVLLQAVEASKTKFALDFVKYAQSSAVVSPKDSSVSYAAGVLYPLN
eukprot:TRINITY_DN6233_c0_g1_i1.p1 TRINITY_DN6233_c0_g1~~TRINITY_DN6233_c0_g1_i1.p1  ORF type:complete len:297 (+),score=43.52 TRINITY_DN6233_c0_g1_i1:14-904(+)